ncbi:aminoglycoside phosphotransferase (APT) family kinase protein [Nocardia transvalensis]|uniref:Aminoglycoside phosphotransferase (APT) family kinase protein n=1 Tax=Nocardia transvalensis TaxID=37333 RepID=A0A7W9PL90_9NOCA|nr:aminoglycoside phosphotransferase family protein [Nocardia transvalensis]MBB5918264.1 aminoglycoside phosphotransferase (APT) family kinase protein [Nocardia transvalensis]
MKSAELPTDPSQLTAAWLGSVLDVDISAVRVEAVGTGQTGATYRLTPVYTRSSDAPRSLIAKLPSQQEEVRARVALGYRAEHAFYTRVAGTVSVPLPRVHHCEITGDGAEFVLLMSDLDPAVQGDQIRGCGEAEARLAVGALAGLHGPRWCDPGWLSLEGVTMPRPDADFARGMGELAHVALDATLSGIGDHIGAADRATLTEAADLVEGWLGLDPDRFCLLHGDFRLDNLLFDPGGTSVTVVDWQTIAIGLPARDLAYFLGTSLDTALRERAEADLVEVYHRRLLGHGVTGYSAADCWNDYRVGMLQIPMLITLGYAFAATTDRGDEAFLAMLARGCRAMRHLGTIEFVRRLTT